MISLSGELTLTFNGLDADAGVKKLRVPLLLVGSRHDRYLPVADALKLLRDAHPKDKRTALYPGAFHGWDIVEIAPYAAKARSLVLDWLRAAARREAGPPDARPVAARAGQVREDERRRLAAGLHEPALAGRRRSSRRSRPPRRPPPAAGAGSLPPRTRRAAASIIGVSAIPGQTALSLIGASSGATLRTKPTTACFVSE